MGWRDSYLALVDLFPQVDTRLIKGAALEHGNDIASAAEFIISEVLVLDENLDNEQQLNSDHSAPKRTSEVRQKSSENVGDQPMAAGTIDTDFRCNISGDQESGLQALSASRGELHFLHLGALGETFLAGGLSDNLKQGEGIALSVTKSGPGLVHSNQEVAGVKCDELYTTKVIGENVESYFRDIMVPSMWNKELGVSYHGVSRVHDDEIIESSCHKSDDVCFSESKLLSSLDPTGGEEGFSRVSDDLLKKEMTMRLDQIEKFDAQDYVGAAVATDKISEALASDQCKTCGEHDGQTGGTIAVCSPSLDSFLAQHSKDKDETMALGVCLESMLSIEKSYTSVDSMDWGGGQSSSIDITPIETLDSFVEQAQCDKDVLINSVRDIRALRLKADQAEYAARQAKDEAARGGLDVLLKVDEMRQMLARAREANAVRAGEVYGEKAVLATEARELRSRLVQVKAEKALALSVLNQIKSSLQGRINIANEEREAAQLEKAQKEVLAREVLAKEEASVAKVAQESRDLDAEAEACTKLREFLIEHGRIVDALQGEVAVLCEDAEALKKDLDGMSLSYSGGYMHLLSQSGSHMYGIGSRSGKSSQCDRQPEDAAFSCGDDSVSLSPCRVPIVREIVGEKKLWSPLPSLLRSLSGSQESSSSNNSIHSLTVASNPAGGSSSRRLMRFSDGRNHSARSGECTEDSNYVLSPTSPRVMQAEQAFYEAQMAMFPGEEIDVICPGSDNLDIFRTEKSDPPRSGTDDEDWHLLDSVRPSRSSSGRSCSSCISR